MTHDRDAVGVIGDEDTITGFKICGLVEHPQKRNFIAVDLDTSEESLANYFLELVSRSDISIVFVCDFVADKIRTIIDEQRIIMPSIMEVSSKLQNRV